MYAVPGVVIGVKQQTGQCAAPRWRSDSAQKRVEGAPFQRSALLNTRPDPWMETGGVVTPMVDVKDPADQRELPTWFFGLSGALTVWEWAQGPPEVRALESVRLVRSSTYSRNVPVHAYSMTTGTVLTLESGLEHVLVMMLDRRRDISWLVAQPMLLSWSKRLSHYPDLMTVKADGSVTVWDARPTELQDIEFNHKAELTAKACEERGWRYETFGGLSQTAEVNLRWLATARRAPAWLEPARAVLREQSAGPEFALGDVVKEGADTHTVSALWHLAWSGELDLDLDHHWDEDTTLSWAQEAS